MAIQILEKPRLVAFERIVEEIAAFNASGQNPFGPNVPVKTHCPLTVIVQGAGIDLEFEFYPADRRPEASDFLQQNPTFRTRHAIIYPMTRAMIVRQWHRVYAFDVQREVVTDVKLLVTRKQDPELFTKHPAASAWSWFWDVKNSPEPVTENV